MFLCHIDRIDWVPSYTCIKKIMVFSKLDCFFDGDLIESDNYHVCYTFSNRPINDLLEIFVELFCI
ncbi:hypothetical protein AYJ66_17420 [Dietzia cinnamea]|nr:hypothetical protein AYJ66_17420 [Dietzia cinnamea]